MLTLDGYAAMLLRVNAFAAVPEQLRAHFASDERLPGGGRATTIRKKRSRLVHRVSSVAAARRFSEEGSRGLDLKCRRDVLVSRLVLQSQCAACD